MAAPTAAQMLEHLNAARKSCLQDAMYYGQVIPQILSHVGPDAILEVRRWGTDLFAEAFSSPALDPEIKEALALKVLPTLKAYLETPGEDATVVKNMILIATSIYPLVFKYIVFHPDQSSIWDQLTAIKSNILRRDSAPTAPAGLRVCCIKFIQRVIQAYTPDYNTNTAQPQKSEANLELLQKPHQLLEPTTLEAEGSGLLDRMLSVFHETEIAKHALILTATLNSANYLITARPTIAGRILNIIIAFNPFHNFGLNSSPRDKLVIRSVDRTVRAFMLHLTKRQPNHPYTPRMHAYLDRLQHVRLEMLQQQTGQKRGPPVEPLDDEDNAKRPRIEAHIQRDQSHQFQWSSLGGTQCTMADVYTLTGNENIKAFDVQRIQPPQLIPNLIVKLLDLLPSQQMGEAFTVVRTRWEQIQSAALATAPPVQVSPPLDVEDDDEEYSPDEGILAPLTHSTLAATIATSLPIIAPHTGTTLVPYIVPQPTALTYPEVVEYGSDLVGRVFGLIGGLQEPNSKVAKSGFNRVAASTYDRDSWITVVSRLATRSMTGLSPTEEFLKMENGVALTSHRGFSLSDALRESLFRYVLEDWRERLDVAVTWLNEEWYNDQVAKETEDDNEKHYEIWALRVFDGILPYLDAKDKVLIRFLSEIQSINQEILERVKRLAKDPERVPLAVNAIHYLALFRPPVRDMCIDALEDLYVNYEDAKASATKPLQKWRPQVLQTKAEPIQESDAKAEPAATTDDLAPPPSPPGSVAAAITA